MGEGTHERQTGSHRTRTEITEVVTFIHILFTKIPYRGVYPMDVGIVNKLAL